MSCRQRAPALFLVVLLCGCGHVSPGRIPAKGDALNAGSHASARDIEARLSRLRFLWPVEGPVSSEFGKRGGSVHEGIDILAPGGTPVRAAEPGTVLYAGDGLRGYGNTVILDHGDGVTTLYAHLKAFRVQSGDAVAVGAVIGTVGHTGNATTTHVHFEIRVDGKAVNPLAHLAR
jgi:lipoprotein NlpD